MTDPFRDLDAVAQAELVAKGDVTPLDLVDAAIARIESVNGDLNAVVHERFDAARAEASSNALPDGPFRGVPLLVKDLDGMTAGDPYHAGTRHLQRVGFRAEHDSELQARLKRAGFVVLGRTNAPELGLEPTTEPVSTGPTRNPWDPSRSPGGSSGGSAAAVASRMVPVAHAGDGGGSIRIPASACGLVGLLPSRGRVSVGPDAGESWGGLVRRLAVTRTVRDTAAVLDAVHGNAPGDPYGAPTPVAPYLAEVGADPGRLRIGILTDAADPAFRTAGECRDAVEDAGLLLESLGHDVGPARFDLFEDEAFFGQLSAKFINAFSPWVAAEVDAMVARSGQPLEEGDLEVNTEGLVEMGRAVSALQYLDAIDYFNQFTRRAAGWWAAGNDLLLTPTTPELPPPLGSFAPLPDNPLNGLIRSTATVQFTIPFNITGQPAIALPLRWTDGGLPVGVQLVAAYGREDLLIRVASQLEIARPWADRLPPIHA